MSADTIQKSVLDWLQLTPELLSGLSGQARRQGRGQPAAPAPQDEPASTDHASISVESVLASSGMGFLPVGSSLSFPVAGAGYEPIERGGTQRAALAEMTGYLSTRLAPSPMPSKD